MQRKTVLLIESHDDTRELYAEYLGLYGLDVIPAATTDDAMAHPAADAIVTAISVRGSIEALEFVRQFRQTEAKTHTPIIVVTSHTLEGDRRRAFAAGCDVFLPKPCAPERLRREIRRMLALGRVPKPVGAHAKLHRSANRPSRVC